MHLVMAELRASCILPILFQFRLRLPWAFLLVVTSDPGECNTKSAVILLGGGFYRANCVFRFATWKSKLESSAASSVTRSGSQAAQISEKVGTDPSFHEVLSFSNTKGESESFPKGPKER